MFNEENGSLEYRVKVSAKSLPLPVVQIVKTDEDGKAITSKNFAFSAYRDEECKNLRNEVAGDPKTALRASRSIWEKPFIFGKPKRLKAMI